MLSLLLLEAAVVLAQVKNEGIDCWFQCGSKPGACDFCGKEGACCRLGWDSDPTECGGFGNRGFHSCVRIWDYDGMVKESLGKCAKCTSVYAWPCYDESADTGRAGDPPPCFAPDMDTGKCKSGQYNCRSHGLENQHVQVDKEDFKCETESTKRSELYKVVEVDEDASVHSNKVSRDSQPYGKPDPRRLLLTTSLSKKSARPTNLNIKLDWKDQGWGNRKGHIFLCYKGRQQRLTPVSAAHARMTYDLSVGEGLFFDWAEGAELGDSDDALYFMYSVGGGGGHVLFVYDMTVTFMFEKSKKEMAPMANLYTYGSCKKDENKFHAIVRGRTCTEFCSTLSRGCVSQMKGGSNYCDGIMDVDEKGKQTDDCDRDDSWGRVCQCTEVQKVGNIPTARPTYAEGSKQVYSKFFDFYSLNYQQGKENKFYTDAIEVSKDSTLHLVINAIGSVDWDRDDETHFDYVIVNVFDAKKKQVLYEVVRVDGYQWTGRYTHHMKTSGTVMLEIVSWTNGPDEAYSVDISVDNAKISGKGGNTDLPAPDKDTCGFPLKKIKFTNFKEISLTKKKVGPCDCEDACAKYPAWYMKVKGGSKGKCICIDAGGKLGVTALGKVKPGKNLKYYASTKKKGAI